MQARTQGLVRKEELKIITDFTKLLCDAAKMISLFLGRVAWLRAWSTLGLPGCALDLL